MFQKNGYFCSKIGEILFCGVMILYAMQQIDIDFDANKTQPPPAPSKGGYLPLEGAGGG
jgi:hypothetical protein